MWYKYTVKYQVATYSGETTVITENEDEDFVIAKAKRKVSKGIAFPLGYQSWKITEKTKADL